MWCGWRHVDVRLPPTAQIVNNPAGIPLWRAARTPQYTGHNTRHKLRFYLSTTSILINAEVTACHSLTPWYLSEHVTFLISVCTFGERQDSNTDRGRNSVYISTCCSTLILSQSCIFAALCEFLASRRCSSSVGTSVSDWICDTGLHGYLAATVNKASIHQGVGRQTVN